jgi:hypothetical protein
MNFCLNKSERFVFLISFLRRVLLLLKCFRQYKITYHSQTYTESEIIYIGQGDNSDYFSSLLNLTPVKKEKIYFPFWIRQVSSCLKAKDLIIIEVNRTLGFLLKRKCIEWPILVRHKLSLSSDSYKSRITSIEASYGRYSRRNNATYDFSDSTDDMIKYYNEYYKPYAEFRYGENTRIHSYKAFMKNYSKLLLLKVYDDNGWQSGGIIKRKGSTATLLNLGLKSDYLRNLKKGYLSSVYYFLIQWCKENKIEIIDLTRSRPLRDNGVFQHKQKWGAEYFIDPWPHTSFFIPKNSRLLQLRELRSIIIK